MIIFTHLYILWICLCSLKDIIKGNMEQRDFYTHKVNGNEGLNPYHAKGYSQLVPNYATQDYSCDQSKCSTMPSATIVA